MASFNPSLTFAYSINWGGQWNKFLLIKRDYKFLGQTYVTHKQPSPLPTDYVKASDRSQNWRMLFKIIYLGLLLVWGSIKTNRSEGAKVRWGQCTKKQGKVLMLLTLGKNYSFFSTVETGLLVTSFFFEALEEAVLLRYQRKARL